MRLQRHVWHQQLVRRTPEVTDHRGSFCPRHLTQTERTRHGAFEEELKVQGQVEEHKDTYPHCGHRPVSTRMICLQQIFWRGSLPPQKVQAFKGFLIFLSLTRPVHTELGHIFSEEIRESPHVSWEAINAARCCRGRKGFRLFVEIFRDFLAALHRDGHHITEFSIRNTSTCRQRAFYFSESWPTHVYEHWNNNRFHVDLAVSAELLWVDVTELPVSGKVTSGEETAGTVHCTLPPSHQLTDLQLENTENYTKLHSHTTLI